jgi:hypothetical protein
MFHRYPDQKLTREEALRGMTIDGELYYRLAVIG